MEISSFSPESLWIIAIASLVGVVTSVLGCFLVLRRMAMLGDAISHAVLPGIVLAFLLSGTRSLIPMFIGAASLGLFTAWASDILHRRGRLQEDASIGVTFTWLFAIGIILISLFAGQVDLDQECVLYGEIAFAPLDTISAFGFDIPRTFVSLAVVNLITFLFVIACYHRLKVCCFDNNLAAALGIRVNIWHYLLMTLVSIATVASFEAVGAILVVAMLVVPANVGYVLSSSLIGMLFIAVATALASSFFGYQLASYYDGSISAAIALVGGALLLSAVVAKNISNYINTKMRSKEGV